MGLFSKKKKDEEKLEEITPEIKAKLDEYAERGNRFQEEEQYEEALQAWEEGLALIPEPQQYYAAVSLESHQHGSLWLEAMKQTLKMTVFLFVAMSSLTIRKARRSERWGHAMRISL